LVRQQVGAAPEGAIRKMVQEFLEKVEVKQ
jgi:hypothetical protein